ncbi:DUF4386 family protein [Leifsonia sp. McL0607]|uniref:DUF4386 family protein n=1 Tax=Leifsonia sp. McL0607 TaxID=3415672 RepID=UPI003CF7E51C
MDMRETGIDSGWRPVIRFAAISAIVVTAMIPLQAAIFLLWPPPTTTLGYFALFADHPLLGLLDLDLLLTIDYLLMIPLYIALFAVVERTSRGWALVALVVGLLSLGLFFVSREATFSMWQLSSQYAVADHAADRAALTASAQTLLTLYTGGTFGLSYLLGAASTLIFSIVMVRRRIFGRLPGAVGIATGVTMLVPANVGTVGVVVAMLSLIPTAWWLILLSRSFFRLLRTSTTHNRRQQILGTTTRVPGDRPPRVQSRP